MGVQCEGFQRATAKPFGRLRRGDSPVQQYKSSNIDKAKQFCSLLTAPPAMPIPALTFYHVRGIINPDADVVEWQTLGT